MVMMGDASGSLKNMHTFAFYQVSIRRTGSVKGGSLLHADSQFRQLTSKPSKPDGTKNDDPNRHGKNDSKK